LIKIIYSDLHNLRRVLKYFFSLECSRHTYWYIAERLKMRRKHFVARRADIDTLLNPIYYFLKMCIQIFQTEMYIIQEVFSPHMSWWVSDVFVKVVPWTTLQKSSLERLLIWIYCMNFDYNIKTIPNNKYQFVIQKHFDWNTFIPSLAVNSVLINMYSPHVRYVK
jgi:hypothetical protein